MFKKQIKLGHIKTQDEYDYLVRIEHDDNFQTVCIHHELFEEIMEMQPEGEDSREKQYLLRSYNHRNFPTKKEIGFSTYASTELFRWAVNEKKAKVLAKIINGHKEVIITHKDNHISELLAQGWKGEN